MDFMNGLGNWSETSTPLEILNWYRCLYCKEGTDNERGVMTETINNLFKELEDFGVLENLNMYEKHKRGGKIKCQ